VNEMFGKVLIFDIVDLVIPQLPLSTLVPRGVLSGHSNPYWSTQRLQFSPDTSSVATASEDGRVCVSNVNGGEILYQEYVGYSEWIWDVVFGQQGTTAQECLFACSQDGNIYVLSPSPHDISDDADYVQRG